MIQLGVLFVSQTMRFYSFFFVAFVLRKIQANQSETLQYCMSSLLFKDLILTFWRVNESVNI